MPDKRSSPPVILVTGAGKGIGRAVAEGLAARARARTGAAASGVRLLLAARTQSDLAALQAALQGDAVDCGIVAGDLADQPLRPLEACLERHGRIDALIHCAGVGRFKDFLEQTPEDLEFTLRTNVTATFLLLQRAYAAMKAQAPGEGGLRGQIQVVTSIAAEQPFAQSSTYCLSKYAQRGLLDVMRLYGRQDGIRILEVRPGAAYTPMWGDMPSDQVARMMTAEDVAQPMVDALSLSAHASIENITLRPLHGDL
jgi:sepiapterin reductase